ncbi:putative MFS multidrug transporter [Aspergillus saccharolyticus JOP 1030-1]|uniref:MFS general substrate transporter n=1 Tax=Aspergillus saccharolyticus JOP 1030-1 TaxID=1450539 RepID=A0A318ZPJ9_9EURO|nr:MFS general substrate transporter [Aspergillus saccharolyticus JOP 1030-1]PYH48565.1 MFS general substrate transporter [Aspergillus saccharolyticus JOP 1030-1]
MTAVTSQQKSAPSEQTPLLGRSEEEAVHDAPRVPVTVLQGSAVMIAMGLLLFIQATQITAMTTAQSAIAAEFDAFSVATWFSSVFLIAYSSITPLSGRLCQIFTPRVYVLFTTSLLALGLFVTASAPSLTVFLLGRAIAGCGAGGQTVTAFVLALDLTSKKRRGLFLGLISVAMTTGISSGAVLSGLLTTVYGWRLIFWVQAPITLILAPIMFFAIPVRPEDERLDARRLLRKLAQVDYAGALTLTLSVTLLLSSLASSTIQIAPIVGFLISSAIFLLVEARVASQPIIPTGIVQLRSVRLTCFAGLITMMARWSVLFYTPVYAMVVRDWSPASAGLILVPTNAGFGLGGVLAGWLHIRKSQSYYLSSLTGYLLFALASFILTTLATPTSAVLAFICATFLHGLTVGALLNYTLSHLLHLTHADIHYIVGALVGMSRGFAGSFGSAIGGGFFIRELKKGLERGFERHGMLEGKGELVRKLLGSPALVKSLTGVEREVAVRSYQVALQRLFLASCGLILLAGLAQAGTGWRVSDGEKRVQQESECEREDEGEGV